MVQSIQKCGPAFLNRLSPLETDFVLLHEIAHVALGHCFRDNDRDSGIFNSACDLVVNSMLLSELGISPGMTWIAGASVTSLQGGRRRGSIVRKVCMRCFQRLGG